ncbi:hypothetical protein DL89DRAFT_91062 [Linderina pennispora]|uniref:Uncharacterized protein n=1 Tax=Linderina pennispora TaxID=61395 RepID=A0A1Y1WIE9_9FUNG|nr:uncharacterized protein DL89DRAFT_91062 [Linderina pennispora]ORX73307.1 hypothetical protein DL89DRAFT_91062 [Linderina pennispora]
MQCSLENSTAGKAAAPTTFTLCVTRPDGGAQVGSATSITELCVEGGDGFAQAVEQALDERADSAGSVWLDVSSPSAADIICLAQIFDMDSTTTSDLLSGAGSGNNAATSQQNGPWPACQVTSRALYLCWQETIATEAGLGQYLVKGTVPGQIDTALEGHGHGSWWAADLVPVPQWLMPSASKAVSGYHMSTVVKMMVDGSVGASDAEVERMRQQYVQQLLGLLDRPRRRDTSGLLSAIRRWGTRYERWAGLLGRSRADLGGQSGRSSDFVGDILGVTQALVGRGTVQVWVQGPIVLTFHREPSQAISDIQRELGGDCTACQPRQYSARPY